METLMCEITAKATLHDHELNDVSVLNPGDWFGKTWLLEIGGSYSPLFLIVEADSMEDAIEELADDERYGHLICVDDGDLDDYPEDERHYGPSGQVLDLDHLMIYGQEGSETPFPCRYYGGCLPDEGMLPTEFYCREDD
jgi:hypothetical protein